MRKTYRSTYRSVTLAAATAALLITGPAAHAALTTYTSQSAYLAAVGETGVDTYDDLDIVAYATPFHREAGDYTYVATTGPTSTNAYGASDNDIDWYLSTAQREDTLTFSGFGAPIAGAGGFFFGGDIAGFTVDAPYIIVAATDSKGATLTYTVERPTPTSFLGFVSDALIVSLSVTSGGQDGLDGFGIYGTVNDLHLSVAAPVPEPATYGMLALGLGVMGVMARRRRNG
ncbi:PEP-CTERM sorting domain-containing protein [Pseudoduganella sp. SL102]|uniref:PEP-CTERM sorting domain-containing protein n=1 Tax=Pseudoduganella sp. SL102 TaxID=2995154 RepID=UPI00248CB782|nr:PEP-CTERM sorting domain-containing protein [Pseudoduganella sp. SL102]WBS04167.1 PEP-CTERM sorting domain-containing protein [Pseudoduganella sp. SL102]